MSELYQIHAPKLLNDIQARFAVGPQYADAYLSYWARTHRQTFGSLDEILSLPPPAPMWFEYALSTNWRGGQVWNLLAPHIPAGATRYLDVGCGFGGFLVTFARQGFEVVGIEVDPVRLDLSRANCADNSMGNCVLHASILEDDLPARLGQFDVITCIDVIEHVLDVPKTIRAMAAMLRPGGILMMEIPNRNSLRAVASDGHFGLFGITLLSRRDAIEYHRQFFDFAYDVGDYFDLSFYRELLQRTGCSSETLQSPLHTPARVRETEALVRGLALAYQEHRRMRHAKLPASIQNALHRQLQRYMARLAADCIQLALPGRKVPAFKERYLTGFWTLLARKTA